MAHIYSKGWYVQELKKAGITKLEGKNLKSFKTYVLRNLHAEKVLAK